MDVRVSLIGIPERQREVAGIIPGQPHGDPMTILAIQRPQPRDERRPVGFRDGGVCQKLRGDHLPIVGVIALDGFGNERMRPGADLDAWTLSVVRLLDCGITGGEVREAKHMHGGSGQDELPPGDTRRCPCQTPAISGDEDSVIVR